MGTPANLRTARLTLVPATAALARAETEDRPAFAALLGAAVPDAWPPEMLADALPFFLRQLEAGPELAGWITWYGVADADASQPRTLVASGGFLGPPQEGKVEIGYSVLPSFQRKGYGAEMVAGLTDWALAQPGVQRVLADVALGNTPSVRLLHRAGFSEIGPSDEPGHIRFEMARGQIILSESALSR
jgi:ribosomal-protein-alanine N-acetyltransferase